MLANVNIRNKKTTYLISNLPFDGMHIVYRHFIISLKEKFIKYSWNVIPCLCCDIKPKEAALFQIFMDIVATMF